MLEQPLIFTGCSNIQFLNSPPYPNTVKKNVIPFPSLCSTFVTCGTLYHSIGYKALFIQALPREVENFPRGGKYCKGMFLPTCLEYLQRV